MTSPIITPGTPAFEMPSRSEEALAAIFQQLQQVTAGINTLAGQLDMGLRLASGQMSKHQVKVKFEQHDKKVRLAVSADQALRKEEYEDAPLDDPALD